MGSGAEAGAEFGSGGSGYVHNTGPGYQPGLSTYEDLDAATVRGVSIRSVRERSNREREAFERLGLQQPVQHGSLREALEAQKTQARTGTNTPPPPPSPSPSPSPAVEWSGVDLNSSSNTDTDTDTDTDARAIRSAAWTGRRDEHGNPMERGSTLGFWNVDDGNSITDNLGKGCANIVVSLAKIAFWGTIFIFAISHI